MQMWHVLKSNQFRQLLRSSFSGSRGFPPHSSYNHLLTETFMCPAKFADKLAIGKSVMDLSLNMFQSVTTLTNKLAREIDWRIGKIGMTS